MPIPGPSPSGEDLLYSGVYDAIKAARFEEPDLPMGEWAPARPRKVANWELVAKLCSDALKYKSKDLRIAVWLTEAMLRLKGYPGLKEGLGP